MFESRFLLLALAAAFAFSTAPAHADMTARYVAPGTDRSMTIEVTDDGALRSTLSDEPHYLVAHGEEAFIIDTIDTPPIVARAADVIRLMAEHREAMSAPGGTRETPSALTLVENGTATVNGRTGRAYHAKSGDRVLSRNPFLVISDDPELARLGDAMRRQSAISTAMLAPAIGNDIAFAHQTDKILETGTPIFIMGMELRSIDTAPIAPERFALPTEPQSLETLRKTLAPDRGR